MVHMAFGGCPGECPASTETFTRELRLAAAVKWTNCVAFRRGEPRRSWGCGADFIDALGRYGVSLFLQTADEILGDVEEAGRTAELGPQPRSSVSFALPLRLEDRAVAPSGSQATPRAHDCASRFGSAGGRDRVPQASCRSGDRRDGRRASWLPHNASSAPRTSRTSHHYPASRSKSGGTRRASDCRPAATCPCPSGAPCDASCPRRVRRRPICRPTAARLCPVPASAVLQ